MATEEKPVVEETTETQAQEPEKATAEAKEPEKEPEKEDEEKIDVQKEKKKPSQDRAWERIIEKNARLSAKLEQLEQKVHEQQQQQQQQYAQNNTSQPPKREEFDDIGAFLEAKQEYNNLVLEQRIESRLAQMQQQQPQSDTVDWDSAEAKARAKYSDYDDVVEEANNIMVPEVAIEAIRRSPVGPDLTYYLAKNPAEAQKLSRMKVAGDQIFFLGQLAGRLTEAKTIKPKASSAPKPIAPVKTSAGTVETDRDRLSDEEWFAIRAKEKRQRMGFKT